MILQNSHWNWTHWTVAKYLPFGYTNQEDGITSPKFIIELTQTSLSCSSADKQTTTWRLSGRSGIISTWIVWGWSARRVEEFWSEQTVTLHALPSFLTRCHSGPVWLRVAKSNKQTPFYSTLSINSDHLIAFDSI